MSSVSPVPEAREGLPPCFTQYAQHEGRVAVSHDPEVCQWKDDWLDKGSDAIFAAITGKISGKHPFNWFVKNRIRRTDTWEKAERWVRTGEL